jgi:chromosome segregation ATPase
MKLSSPIAVLLLSTSVLASACDKKVQECNKVAEVANAAVSEMHKIEGEMRGETHDPDALSKDAKVFIDLIEKASKDISAVEITTEELKKRVGTYTAMLDSAAAATKEMLAELEKADGLTEEKLQASQKALSDAQGALGQACAGGAPDCEKIGEVMEKLPDDAPSEDEIGNVLAAHAADLEKLELEDEGIKKAKVAYIGVVNEYVDLIGKAQRLDASMQKVDAAVATEDDIVASINQFCQGS